MQKIRKKRWLFGVLSVSIAVGIAGAGRGSKPSTQQVARASLVSGLCSAATVMGGQKLFAAYPMLQKSIHEKAVLFWLRPVAYGITQYPWRGVFPVLTALGVGSWLWYWHRKKEQAKGQQPSVSAPSSNVSPKVKQQDISWLRSVLKKDLHEKFSQPSCALDRAKGSIQLTLGNHDSIKLDFLSTRTSVTFYSNSAQPITAEFWYHHSRHSICCELKVPIDPGSTVQRYYIEWKQDDPLKELHEGVLKVDKSCALEENEHVL